MANPRSIRVYDRAEDVVRKCRDLLRTYIQAEINTEFTRMAAADIIDFGEAITTLTIDTANIIEGNLETTFMDIGQYPFILIDVEDHVEEDKDTPAAFGNTQYAISLAGACMHDESRKLRRLVWRFAQAVNNVIKQFEYLDGLVRGCRVKNTIYSLDLKLEAGWVRGFKMDVIYYGTSD